MARTELAMIPLQAEGWTQALAMVLAFAFSLGLGLLILFNRWNRADLDTEHAAHILSQLNGFGGSRTASVVVRSRSALDDVETIREIRGLFHGEQPSEHTVRSATWEIVREVRAELSERRPDVSKVPLRVVQEAVLTAILGALAIIPVAAWREASRSGGGAVPSLADFATGGSAVLDGALTALTAFPLADFLFAMSLALGILSAQTIWTLWWAPPLALLALAGAYWILEQRVETERDLTGPPVTVWAVRFVSLAIILWFVGTSLAVIGAVLPGLARPAIAVLAAVLFIALFIAATTQPDGEPMTDGGQPPEDGEDVDTFTESDPFADMGPVDGEDGGSEWDTLGAEPPTGDESQSEDGPTRKERTADAAGPLWNRIKRANWKQSAMVGGLGLGLAHEVAAFLAAAVIVLAVMFVWLRRTLRRWSYSAKRDGRDAFALDVVHSLTVTVAALTLPVMVGYGVVAIGTGKVIRVASAVIDAPDGSGTILALAILAAMIALAAAVALLNRFSDLRAGIRRGLSVQSVRIALFGKALPFALMGVTAVLALAFVGANFVAVIAVTLAVGLIARFAFQVYHYASYQYRSREGREKSASRVVVNGRKVTDADGESVLIADVNGHRTAHRRLDPLINQIREDGHSLFRKGTPVKGSFPRYYYLNGVKRGKVDMESVADELLGDVRTRFEVNVKRADADAPAILEKLHSEYPNHVVDRVVQNLKDRSVVSRREDTFVWLGR